ncbi:ABC transporter substrate-binding protein [Thalassobius sp. Cn5-15]|uniref:ABC transporter substrate-binding protein n=1 Tax=Thalassobius sp. Cn5-15 TaxID=2917763 RepID=UPI001EF3B890|nr:extracellular solute-binding protein [Thalassobius sp. Cn5-15]MCG7495039.1 extracellular solute-binding protein [Thalassobius sp. Cn5-15]
MKKTLKTMAFGCAAAICATGAFAQDKVKLLVWGDPVREPFYQAFDEARDDIDVEFVSVARNEMVAKLQLALRSGEGVPDAIFMQDVNFAAQLSTRRANYLMELSDKVDQETVDGFYPTSLVPCEKANGSLICLRNDVAHFMLWYNAPLMEELGLSVPTTWEEYEKVGAAAAANDSGIVSGAVAMHIPLMNFLYSNGCELAVPQANNPETLKINATSPQCVEAAQLVDRMLDTGSLARVAPFDPEFLELAKANKLLMIPGPTWFGEFIIKRRYEFADGMTGVAMTPKWAAQDEPLVWSWGGGVWGGWKDTKHPEAVVDLLKFVTTDVDVNRTAVTMPAYQPASVEWGTAFDGSGYYATDGSFDTMVDAAAFGHPGYASLRLDTRASFTKAVVNDLASGASFESLLPQLQEEFVNAAQLAGYKVITD